MRAVAADGRVVGVAALGLLAALAGTAGVQLERAPATGEPAAALVYLPDARLLRPLVLGYDNVLANVVWFRTISYFGEHYTGDHLYPWLARMCDLVTDLDPRAEHVYRFAGLVLPWEAGEVGEGIRLLQKGLRVFPRSWTLRYYLGIVRYVFQQDVAGAADDIRQAAELPDAPPIVARFAALLEARRSGPETTIAILEQMREHVTSPEARAVIDRSILDARVAWDVERLNGLVATYRERTGAFPADLGALVDAGLLRGVPPDPYGGVYEVDPTSGTVRSSTGRVPTELQQSPRARELQQRGEVRQ
jgi:hypothetical protein